MGGVSRNKIKQVLHAIFKVQTWKLVLILILLLFASAVFLRFDHIGMTERRDAVLQADEEGNDEAIRKSLDELKAYVRTHIVVNVISRNGVEEIVFGTGPFYLEQQYVRKAQEELARAEAQLNDGDNPNGNIFKAAQDKCEALRVQYNWGFTKPFFDCIFEELAKYPAQEELAGVSEAMIPPTALYRHDYVSPVWYPSWAGFSILISLLLFIVITIRFLIWCSLSIALIITRKR